MSALLECRQVVKQFGGLTAVNRVDLEVEAGLIFGLIGPNGAGKTTLLRLISGVYPPTSGEILFHGKNIAGFKPHQACKVGVVSTHQIMRPFQEMTVSDNVRVGVEFGRGWRGSNTSQVVSEMLQFTRLESQANKLAKNLTLAGLKRLEIARAMATHPELILLDEVISGLNPTETTSTMDLIRSLRERGITVIMVEHVMKAIMGISDRIIVLNYGEKIAEGMPAEIQKNEAVVSAYLGKNYGNQPYAEN